MTFTFTASLRMNPEDKALLRQNAEEKCGIEDAATMLLADLVYAICYSNLVSNIQYDNIPLECFGSSVV